MSRRWRTTAFVGLVLAVGCTTGPRTGATSAGSSGAAPVDAPSGSAPAAKPAWQVDWEQTVAAAEREGKVQVYAPVGDQLRKNMVEGFQRAYPRIEVEWLAGSSRDQTTRLEAERKAGIYALDAYIGGTSSGTTMKQLRALDPVEPLLVLPEVTDRANWLDNRLDWADTEKQLNLVFVNLAKEVIAFDPRQAQVEDLDEVSELLDPRWKGKIVINDPTLGAGPGKTTMIWIWAVMGPEKATEFMRGLKSQAGAVSRDERQVIEWVARGRYPVLVAPNDSILQALTHEGLKVGVVPGIKDYGTFITASSGSLTLLNRAPHPNAAKVLINWVLSREGQTAYSLATKQPSRRVDVPTDHLAPTSVVQPGGKYWPSYYEENVSVPPALEVALKEIFER